jgi:hypothetical protein
MSITASFEVAKNVYLPSLEDHVSSKAIANLLGILNLYCDYRADPESVADADDKQIVAWFASISAKMSHDICLLNRSWYAGWEYEAEEYQEYLRGEQQYHREQVMTPEQFAANCAQTENAWLDLNELRKTIGDLISALEKFRPPNTWWYVEDDMLADLWEAYRALLGGLQQGHKRVRIMID